MKTYKVGYLSHSTGYTYTLHKSSTQQNTQLNYAPYVTPRNSENVISNR